MHNIIYRVSHTGEAHRRSAVCRSCTPVRKHTFDKAISPDMQSVLSRRRQHAISYVLAGESMDRADRAQGIRLIAHERSRVPFLPLPICFHLLAHFLSPPPTLPFVIILFLFPPPPPPGKRESFFTAETIFNSDESFRYSAIVLSLLRSHECIRGSDYGGRNSQLPRRVRRPSSLALNTRRRAAITSQSELQTKRVSAFQPNIRDVHSPEAVSHSAFHDVGC